mmetsp:Transcript_36476/g.103027  ORF Transcript_36476/g.103027 Transcript_36476/m.103027 type:complete len:241 (-) Transcript_36476:1037-1759(-)
MTTAMARNQRPDLVMSSHTVPSVSPIFLTQWRRQWCTHASTCSAAHAFTAGCYRRSCARCARLGSTATCTPSRVRGSSPSTICRLHHPRRRQDFRAQAGAGALSGPHAAARAPPAGLPPCGASETAQAPGTGRSTVALAAPLAAASPGHTTGVSSEDVRGRLALRTQLLTQRQEARPVRPQALPVPSFQSALRWCRGPCCGGDVYTLRTCGRVVCLGALQGALQTMSSGSSGYGSGYCVS